MDLHVSYAMTLGLGLTIVMLVLLRVAQLVTGHDPALVLRGDNSARRIVQVGDVFAVFVIAGAIARNCISHVLLQDLLWCSSFAVLSVVLLRLFGSVGTRAILGGSLPSELERGNVAAGVAAAGHRVGTGLLLSRAAAGTDLRAVGLALAFFLLAQLTQLAFVAGFRALTTYDDAEQIRGENLAAALSYAGINLAVAIVVGRAVEGEFGGWAHALRDYGMVVGLSVLLYPVRQVVVQGVLLGAVPSVRGGALDRAVGVERNEGMAALEATTYVATALTLAGLL